VEIMPESSSQPERERHPDPEVDALLDFEPAVRK
jgi:hypothetical protein